MIKLFYKGTQKGLEVIDLYKALDEDKSSPLGDKLEYHWDNEVKRAKLKGCKPSLMRALSKTFFLSYMLCGLLQCFQMVLFRYVILLTRYRIYTFYFIIVICADDEASLTFPTTRQQWAINMFSRLRSNKLFNVIHLLRRLSYIIKCVISIELFTM